MKKVLAVDSATMSCSVAVVEAGCLKAELTQETGETHARHLMTMIDNVLQLSNETMADIEGFGVTIGPGTFTGLRIGLSTVQGLALAESKPIAGISSLDALAAQVVATPGESSRLVWALLDARRKEVYHRLYRAGEKGAEPVTEYDVGSPESLVGRIDEPCLMVGNGALLYQEYFQEKLAGLCTFAATGSHTIRAGTVARLAATGLDSFSTEKRVLQPLYIRKSDAELNADKVRNLAG